MAGCVQITDYCHWWYSNSRYQTVIDEIVEVLQGSGACPSLLAYLSDPTDWPQAVELTVLSDRPEYERAAFVVAAREAYRRFEARGSGGWRIPEAFPAFLAHVGELVALLESPRDNRPSTVA